MVDKRCLSLFTIHSPRTWHDCPLNWYVVYLRRVHTTVSQPLFIVRTIFASFSLLFLKLFADAWNWQEYCNCFLSHHWRRSSNGDVLKWYIFSIWHAMPSGRTDRIASVKLTINFTHTHNSIVSRVRHINDLVSFAASWDNSWGLTSMIYAENENVNWFLFIVGKHLMREFILFFSPKRRSVLSIVAITASCAPQKWIITSDDDGAIHFGKSPSFVYARDIRHRYKPGHGFQFTMRYLIFRRRPPEWRHFNTRRKQIDAIANNDISQIHKHNWRGMRNAHSAARQQKKHHHQD